MVLAGNSIGGFISASVAADYPGLVAGLVLLNSAGGGQGRAAASWGQPVIKGTRLQPCLDASWGRSAAGV